MPIRLNPLCALLCGAVLMAGLAVSGSAQAQLGTSANPPAENLFRFKDVPARRDDGLGTMAERRRALARSRARHSPVRHPTQ